MNPITGIEARVFTFGGAVRLFWIAPTDVTYDHVKILRKTTNTISGPTDPTATLVYTGNGEQAVEFRSVFLPDDVAESDLYRTAIDLQSPAWNTTYYYAIYAMNAAESDVSTAVVASAVIPQVSTFEELDVIGQLLVFINSYLNQQIVTGALELPPGVTNVQVVDGPPLLDNLKFPCVALHLDEDAPVGFAVGDDVGHMDDSGDVEVARIGYMSRVAISVVGVTDNPEIRRHLYRLLKGALVAARPLLGRLGMLNMEITGHYSEDFSQYDMPLFSADLTLRGALATSIWVPPTELVITEVDVNQGVLTPQAIDP